MIRGKGFVVVHCLDKVEIITAMQAYQIAELYDKGQISDNEFLTLLGYNVPDVEDDSLCLDVDTPDKLIDWFSMVNGYR